jgi:hypothetical protein
MPKQASPTTILSGTAKVLGAAAALGSSLLVVYWSIQIALGVPDDYFGQTRGGLFLSLAILTNSAGILLAKPYVRIALPVVSLVCLAIAVYFLAYSRS